MRHIAGSSYRQGVPVRSALLAGVATLATIGSVASAQIVEPPSAAGSSMPAAAAPESRAPTAGGLQDIVVTARKRAESAQNVPAAITAISAATIQQRDLTSLERIAAATPELAIGRNATGSGAQLTLRGVGSNSLSIGTEQSIAVILDGVYYGQGRTINEGFFDLGGIEILKGPQSLFYGKNATAGVISITTAGPTKEFTAMARAGYEFNARTVYTEDVVSGPITDTLGFRLAVRASKDFGSLFDQYASPITYNTRDTPTRTTIAPNTAHTAGISHDDGPNQREILTRATLRWEPTNRLRVTLKGSYSLNKTAPGTWNYATYACQGGTSTTTPGTPCRRTFGAYINNLPADIAAQTRYFHADGVNFNTYRSFSGTGTIDYDMGPVSFTSVNNYNQNRNHWANDIDYQSSPTVNIWGAEVSRFHAFSSENRLLSHFDSPINFLLGGYYQSTKLNFDQVVVHNNSENSSAPAGYRYVSYAKSSYTKGETLSAYGQLIWKILPKLEATAGVRYIHETKDSLFVQPYANPRFTPDPAAGVIGTYAVNQPLAANQTFNNWSPEATLTWKPTRDITIFGAYKTAYKSGGFSNSSIQGPLTTIDFFTFGPEKAKGFEAGIKTMLFDNQLRFNIDLYTYKYTDLQVTYLDSASLSYNSINAGSVRSKGVEIEAEYAPRAMPELTLRGTVAYNKARYGNGIAPCYGGQSISAGCLPNLLAAPRTLPSGQLLAGTPGQNLKGTPTSDAPLWTASLGATYDRGIGGNWKLGVSVDGRYSASYLPSAFGSPLSRQPKYINLDASVRLHTQNDKWELAVIAKNLTNQFVVTGVNDASGSGQGTGTNVTRLADQVGFVSLPRTVQVQLTWRY